MQDVLINGKGGKSWHGCKVKKNLMFTLSVHNLFGQKPKWAERLLFKIFPEHCSRNVGKTDLSSPFLDTFHPWSGGKVDTSKQPCTGRWEGWGHHTRTGTGSSSPCPTEPHRPSTSSSPWLSTVLEVSLVCVVGLGHHSEREPPEAGGKLAAVHHSEATSKD